MRFISACVDGSQTLVSRFYLYCRGEVPRPINEARAEKLRPTETKWISNNSQKRCTILSARKAGTKQTVNARRHLATWRSLFRWRQLKFWNIFNFKRMQKIRMNWLAN